MAQRHYRPTQYTFTNVQKPEEEKIYNFDNIISSFTNKIEITYYNYVVVNGRLQDFSEEDQNIVKILCQTYKKLNINDNSNIAEDQNTLFKLYNDSKEFIKKLNIYFCDNKFISNLNMLDAGLEYLSINASANSDNLDLSSIISYPPALKTLIIDVNEVDKYSLYLENLNYGLETLVLNDIVDLPILCNLPPTIKNLIIIFEKKTNSHGEIEYNNRDFIEDFAGIPDSIENLVYKVAGYITNIDFTILPTTMKSMDISRCTLYYESSINEEFEKLKRQLKEHAPNCLIKYEINITY